MVIIIIIAVYHSLFTWSLEIIIIVISNSLYHRGFVCWRVSHFNHILCVFHRLARTARVKQWLCRRFATQRATTSVLTVMLQVSDTLLIAFLLFVHVHIVFGFGTLIHLVAFQLCTCVIIPKRPCHLLFAHFFHFKVCWYKNQPGFTQQPSYWVGQEAVKNVAQFHNFTQTNLTNHWKMVWVLNCCLNLS